MARHPFPGWMPFVKQAAEAMGAPPVVADQVTQLKVLTSISNLLGQAVEHQDDAAPRVILAETEKQLTILRVAVLAGELMIDDVREGLGLVEKPADDKDDKKADDKPRKPANAKS